MWDKADLYIPFHSDHVSECADYKSRPSGFVDPREYNFPLNARIIHTDGSQVVDLGEQHWNSVASSLSDLAVGFFPRGRGENPWPHISIKASPSKILQGHNVFGTEDIRPGILQMLSYLSMAFPKLYLHLDIENTEVRYVDSTYSARVESAYFRSKLIEVFENLFSKKKSISRHRGYLQGNRHSEYRRQKVYLKFEELLHDLEKAKRQRNQSKIEILQDKKLHDFASGLIRFEATTGYRAFLNDGIPVRLREFLKFHDWFEQTHGQPLSQYLWHKAFDKYLGQFEGHTMKNVDDEHIKLKIDAKYITHKNGKVYKRKANAVYKTYRQIKTEGYDTLCKEDNKTFFRNVNYLVEAGISKAFLKSLDPKKPTENVIALVQIIKVDFSNQRPNWYQEPKAGFEDPRRHLKLVS